MKAPINKIIEFSYVDGPGLRTSCFVQKCNISCLYCHNPETQKLCTNCGLCVSKCPKEALSMVDNIVTWDDKKCVNCGTCISVCPNYASPKVKYMEASEVYKEIKKNIPFIRGITVSGGECMLYPLFLRELFTYAKEDNLSCLIDSNGTIDFSKYPDLLSLADGVMLDVKSWDNLVFKRLTGSSNEIIKKNLSYLDKINKIEEIRIVYHKDFVVAKEAILGISKTLNKSSNIKLKLIKYRNNGVRGLMSNLDSPTDDEMNELLQYAELLGFRNIEIR